MATKITTSAVEIAEPLFDAHEIQGNVLPGFNKPHQFYIGLRIDNPQAAKGWLREIARGVATMAHVMRDRLAFRRSREAAAKGTLTGAEKRRLAETNDQIHFNVSFSYPGLQKLTYDAQSFESDAFRIGLAERSPLLGDPTGAGNPGSPRNWVIGAPGNLPDILLIVASDREDRGKERVTGLVHSAEASGMSVIYREQGNVLPGELHGHEHFGFHDNVSQPGVRGKVQLEEGEMYVQRRTIAESELPDHLLYGYPGQDLVWPGQFVLGYPVQTPDPLLRGPARASQPSWAKNGAFLVFRRLRQDVRLFWDVMSREALRLSETPGFEGMTPVRLASLLVGRWPSGAPVARVPDGDNPTLGEDDLANNHFRYDADTCPVALASGRRDEYANAKADPVGLVCPVMSHIRKVNTRDGANDDGGTLGTYARRILRRGLPFGRPLVKSVGPDRVELEDSDPENGNRGLLFVGVVASIEDQFEFLRNRWMSNRSAPRSPGGDDIFIGLNGNLGQRRVRQGVLFGTGQQPAQIAAEVDWIIPTGGGYYFTPSISALRDVLAAPGRSAAVTARGR